MATISKSKQRKIIKTATHYLQEQNLYDKVVCRFDVVTVSGPTFTEVNKRVAMLTIDF
ncbi:MAG: YraN family protein [Coxiellaceae bacterium]|jgi:Holliday junction resolvase-like predicted endonuclease|nr:YraN family protein [Coxiellaceae bacterium]